MRHVCAALAVLFFDFDDSMKCLNYAGNFATKPYAMQLKCASMLFGGEFSANELGQAELVKL